ncbi:glucuronoxylan 4-O-methyltransferase 1 [Benincasa hispida]|uniref:glucuronoxylan 4-O-methyltransferase 1 n=1 Tax=Benincasa hispida TaxID=102211 RepID=UPI0018FFA355|nr:glucuronoxylan 4-O-methyltransferase 1 [Benincasa hispida]
MPPELVDCHSLVPSESLSPPSISPSQQSYPSVSFRNSRGSKSMSFTRNKILPVLVLILSSLSILRLVRIALTTSYTSPLLAIALPPKLQRPLSGFSENHRTSANEAAISETEFKLLSNLIGEKAPCNLLFFGIEPQYLNLSAVNDGGKNVFLEDDPYKLSTFRVDSNHTRMYKIDYKFHAEKAYKLLKQARGNKSCAPDSGLRNSSKCKLALTDLPKEVYEVKWDVVVVDGPRGDSPHAPGRMATIYSAAIMAREGNTTDVVVHDTDRMIERWYSWEFLCDENLISSKGKLWIFRIRNEKNSSRFCPDKRIVVQR